MELFIERAAAKNKLKERIGKWTWGFEKWLGERKKSKLVRKC